MAWSDAGTLTIPNTPEDFSDVTTIDDEDAFALLRPVSPSAQSAFNESISAIIEDVDGSSVYKHCRKFVYAEWGTARAASVFTEVEDTETEVLDSNSVPLRWNGAFKFSLRELQHEGKSGWCLGTSRGHSDSSVPEIDILLAPPTNAWAQRGIAGKHARLYFHKDSYRMVLEARHTVTLGNSGRVVRNSQSQVLGDKDLVVIGDCTYCFEYTTHFQSEGFEAQLLRYIQQTCGPQWAINRLLSPASVGAPLPVGTYFRSPSAFAQGTFGQVAVGWGHDGAAVAVKVFKTPQKLSIDLHQEVMQIIGAHENIVQLLDCFTNFQTQIPSACCIYSPLAVMTLDDLINSCKTSSATQVILLKDYLAGLSHLHGKGIMHRDIKPANMAVRSLQNPIGVILDLDAAIISPTSTDHKQGTIRYLAPEIIALKKWDSKQQDRPQPMPPAYEKSVDVWALGLSMFALVTEKHWSWRHFSTKDDDHLDRYSDERYDIFCERLEQLTSNSLQSGSGDNPTLAFLLDSILNMTEGKPKNRPPASELLQRVQSSIIDENMDITINPKQSGKRKMVDKKNRSQGKRQHVK